MFQILLTQKSLKSQIVVREIQILFILSIVTTLVIMAVSSVLAVSTMPGNHTSSDSSAGNMTFVGNMTGGRSMMMPAGNMTRNIPPKR
ncbi:MAG: hypothetical protein WCC17_19310 [Candidatus Nitrosopolaris sp.]